MGRGFSTGSQGAAGRGEPGLRTCERNLKPRSLPKRQFPFRSGRGPDVAGLPRDSPGSRRPVPAGALRDEDFEVVESGLGESGRKRRLVRRRRACLVAPGRRRGTQGAVPGFSRGSRSIDLGSRMLHRPRARRRHDEAGESSDWTGPALPCWRSGDRRLLRGWPGRRCHVSGRGRFALRTGQACRGTWRFGQGMTTQRRSIPGGGRSVAKGAAFVTWSVVEDPGDASVSGAAPGWQRHGSDCGPTRPANGRCFSQQAPDGVGKCGPGSACLDARPSVRGGTVVVASCLVGGGATRRCGTVSWVQLAQASRGDGAQKWATRTDQVMRLPTAASVRHQSGPGGPGLESGRLA